MYITGTDVAEHSATPLFKLGTLAEVQTADGPPKRYKYIEYEQGAAAVAGVLGEVCYYYGASGATGGYDISKVTSDLSDSQEIGAGVLQSNIPDGNFGWIQIKGKATLSIALTIDADGVHLTPTGAGDGSLDVVDITSVTTSNAALICAVSEDAGDKKIICDFLE